MLEFHFKVAGTDIRRTYHINPYLTIAEFIREIQNLISNDNQMRYMGIETIELVPLYENYISGVSPEDAPALSPSSASIQTIYSSEPTFLYIRQISSLQTHHNSSGNITAPTQATGMATLSPSPGSELTCVICMSEAREVAFHPCGHLCICRGCSHNPAVQRCPICRHPSSISLEIFHP